MGQPAGLKREVNLAQVPTIIHGRCLSAVFMSIHWQRPSFTPFNCGRGKNDLKKAEQADREVVVPKLEQRVSKKLLPQILIVDDPENRTHARADGYMLKYRRVYPKPADPPNAAAPCSAQLKLPHADVYHAHLTLGEPFCLVHHKDQPASAPTVRVAAKITFYGADDRAMLENEGRIYDAFPEHLSEDWSGYNAVGESVTRYTDGRIPATAMVPKFYRYFVPVEESSHGPTRGRPILLLEDYGRPINPGGLGKISPKINPAMIQIQTVPVRAGLRKYRGAQALYKSREQPGEFEGASPSMSYRQGGRQKGIHTEVEGNSLHWQERTEFKLE
ncbi:hypothetical protein FB451DRAFT_1195919 [Mycena latifolia]|nr:hypothetical protein FB451DRAFT_1195919 [Mycena latifolia]